MCQTAHVYGGADATRTLKTDYGTYHVCADCAEQYEAGGYVRSNLPLRSENPRQRCQCEHADHANPFAQDITESFDRIRRTRSLEEGL